MMLDAKRTFDQLIEHLAPDERTRDEVFAQPDLPAALDRGRRLAGVHGDREALRARPRRRLRRARARHAAVAQRARLPRRARAAHPLLPGPRDPHVPAPGRPLGRILGRGTGLVFGVLQRVTGVDLLRDLSVFFRALGGMIDGFTERARRVGALLEDPATTFLIVTAPRHDPVEEAIFFHRKLREAGMPFGGLVVNRVHQPPDGAAGGGRRRLGPRSPSASRPRPASWRALAARDAANVERLRASARRPADDRRPRARGRRPRPRGPRPRALTPVRVIRCSSSATRAQRRVEVAAEHVAQHRAQAAAELARRARRPRGDGRTKPAIAARSSEIASRTRCSSAARSSASAQIAASRSATPLVAGAVGRRTARGRRAASRSAPRRRSPRSQPSSKRRSAQASSPARGVRRATRPQNARSGSSSSALSRQSPARRRRPVASGTAIHGAAVGARLGGRAERGLGVVPQAQRGLEPAQAAAGGLERAPRRPRSPARARRRSRADRRRGRAGASASVVARTRLSPSPSGTSSDSITRPSTGVITTDSAQPAYAASSSSA